MQQTIALHALYKTKIVARQPRPPLTAAKDSTTGKETARHIPAGNSQPIYAMRNEQTLASSTENDSRPLHESKIIVLCHGYT